jgi:dihydroxy-acid dehydratase
MAVLAAGPVALVSATSAQRRRKAAPIALVQDGDLIEIDIPDGTLELQVEPDELARRRATWAGPPARQLTGWLRRYARMATSASKGAILEV